MRISQIKLVKELAPLRKGEGLTPIKLQNKPVLRTIAARAVTIPTDQLTNNQVYSFLLEELARLPKNHATLALHTALGLNPIADKLAMRRSHLALQLKKHADTIERYENQALQDFAAQLIKRSSTPKNHSLSPSSYYLQELEAHTQTLRAITTAGLSRHLSLEGHGDDLMKYLELSRRPYLDAAVHMQLLPSSLGDKWYRFKLSYSFKGKRETFRVAVVLNSADGENLMASGLVDDFHQLNHFDNPKRDIKAISANSKFIVKNPTANTQKLLRLRELDHKETALVLRSTSKPLAQPCWILGVTIPREWQAPDSVYEHHSVINLDTEEHYAYWYAPALMYLKRLTFDFSEFPRSGAWNFSLQPFLGHSPGTIIAEKNLYTLHLNNWIMPGHGIILLWKEKATRTTAQ